MLRILSVVKFLCGPDDQENTMTKDQFDELISLQNKANEAYYGWIRHMMALATGELTALIALQDQFVPAVPRHLWTLSVTWLSLASGLLLAGVVLCGEYDVLFRCGQMKLLAFRVEDEAGIRVRQPTILLTPIQRIAATTFPWLLISSLVFLCWFALANLGNK